MTTLNQQFGILEQSLIKNFLKARKVKPLTKKQMRTLFELMDHREQRAQVKGYEDGKRTITVQGAGKPKILNDDMSSALARMVDANAHLTCAVADLIKKENQ